MEDWQQQLLGKCFYMMQSNEKEMYELGVTLFEQNFPEKVLPINYRPHMKSGIYMVYIINMLQNESLRRNREGDGTHQQD